MRDVDFGDITPDDVFTVGDEEIDWSDIERLASQIDSIQAIENDDDRLEAAMMWAAELGGNA
ncbi:MAG: hypothetical protein ABWY25_07330 [Paenisporosarcina sp.]